jgi:hypothetical protein
MALAAISKGVDICKSILEQCLKREVKVLRKKRKTRNASEIR